ncbi:MAG: HPt (histidine-containing phosphotransfer) domain-containing protein [Burkholderiaceae bacterium]|jgi:HPt (histidine-containing phosphotransfer) domain-containing protein
MATKGIPMKEHHYCAIDPHFLFESAGEDLSLFRELSAMFVRLAGPVHARLQVAMQEGDNTAIHFESHSLKGSTALVGAIALSALLGEIENHARQQRSDLLLPCRPELTRLFDLAMQEVHFSIDHFNGQSGTDAEPVAP